MDLATRYYEEMRNRWNFDLPDELIADEFVFRGSFGDQVRGREKFKDYMRLVQTAFSDFHNQIEHIVASGSDSWDSDEAERSFRRESERHSGMIPNTIGA